jgi:hypothetical protein
MLGTKPTLCLFRHVRYLLPLGAVISNILEG